jgi:hypothetical protein
MEYFISGASLAIDSPRPMGLQSTRRRMEAVDPRPTWLPLRRELIPMV